MKWWHAGEHLELMSFQHWPLLIIRFRRAWYGDIAPQAAAGDFWISYARDDLHFSRDTPMTKPLPTSAYPVVFPRAPPPRQHYTEEYISARIMKSDDEHAAVMATPSLLRSKRSPLASREELYLIAQSLVSWWRWHSGHFLRQDAYFKYFSYRTELNN